MNLGETICRLRTERNMSQGDLADALDVSRQSVSKWENNIAVPELEKLMKMSKLFGITLDELVGQEPPQAPPQQPPQPNVIYIEKPVLPRFTRNQIIGMMLLVCTIVIAVILYSGRFDVQEVLILTVPLLGFALSFLLCKYPLLPCGWIACVGYWLAPYFFYSPWETQYGFLIVGVAAVIAMVAITIQMHRSGRIRIPTWAWVSGTVVLLFLAWLLLVNTVPPFWIGVSSTPVTPK